MLGVALVRAASPAPGADDLALGVDGDVEAVADEGRLDGFAGMQHLDIVRVRGRFRLRLGKRFADERVEPNVLAVSRPCSGRAEGKDEGVENKE